MPDYLTELKYYKENSFLEELDDLNIEVEYRRALENSIGYMLLARCGIDPAGYFTDDDFRDVVDFSTPETLNALGTATGDIGQMCLSAVSRTALTLQRQAERETRKKKKKPTIQYPDAEKKTTTPERSEPYERTDIHDAGRLPAAESASAPGAGNAPWEIRIAAEDIPETAPQSDLHEPADIGQAEPAPDGDRAGVPLPDGTADQPDGDVMGMAPETRANINRMFDFKNEWVMPEGMHGGWQTSGTVRVCQLAFNLWNGYSGERQGDEFTPNDLFCCEFAPYFMEGIKIRYPEYCRDISVSKNQPDYAR